MGGGGGDGCVCVCGGGGGGSGGGVGDGGKAWRGVEHPLQGFSPPRLAA